MQQFEYEGLKKHFKDYKIMKNREKTFDFLKVSQAKRNKKER